MWACELEVLLYRLRHRRLLCFAFVGFAGFLCWLEGLLYSPGSLLFQIGGQLYRSGRSLQHQLQGLLYRTGASCVGQRAFYIGKRVCYIIQSAAYIGLRLSPLLICQLASCVGRWPPASRKGHFETARGYAVLSREPPIFVSTRDSAATRGHPESEMGPSI